MSQHRVRFNVDITINDGKLDAFQAIAQTMIAGTQKEPGALGYDWCLSADHKRCPHH
jgi:quinol monooxygenase YgiN